MLSLVPNVSVFRDALRCIKLWAQRALRVVLNNAIAEPYDRESCIFQRQRLPGRCRLGDACCSNMPIVSQRWSGYYC
jgi:hypothetical protein